MPAVETAVLALAALELPVILRTLRRWRCFGPGRGKAGFEARLLGCLPGYLAACALPETPGSSLFVPHPLRMGPSLLPKPCPPRSSLL